MYGYWWVVWVVCEYAGDLCFSVIQGMLAMVRPGDVWARCWWSSWTLSRWLGKWDRNPSRNPSEVCLSAGIQQGWDEGSSLWSVAELSDAELHFKSFHGKRISIDDWRTVMSHDCVIQGLAPQQPFGTLPRQMLQRKWCSSCRILLRDGYWISVPHKVHIALYSRLAFSKLELSFVLVLTLYSFWPGGANEILATRRDCWRLPLADLALCRAACGVTVYTPWKTLD